MLRDHCFSSLKPIYSDCLCTLIEHAKQKSRQYFNKQWSVFKLRKKRGRQGADITAFLEPPEETQFYTISSKSTKETPKNHKKSRRYSVPLTSTLPPKPTELLLSVFWLSWIMLLIYKIYQNPKWKWNHSASF